MITSLPNDIIIDILARVPRCDYPSLSLVSKHFHSLVASHELYARRSLLGCTEVFLYAVIFKSITSDNRWSILRLKANSKNNRFACIKSLPGMDSNASFVAVGSRIFALGGKRSNVVSVDCRSQTVQHLPSMPIHMVVEVACTIDGKIYVIGCIYDGLRKNFMVVFNIETQMWEREIKKLDMEFGPIGVFGTVVIADKIYMRNLKNSFVYYPKENKWKTDDMLNSNNWKSPCVVDDILYYYDHFEYKLRAYDPKERRWQVVKGLGRFMPVNFSVWSRTVNYGGNLLVFWHAPKRLLCTQENWCAEIALERRQGEEEIWGKVKWCDVVIDGQFNFIEYVAVMV